MCFSHFISHFLYFGLFFVVSYSILTCNEVKQKQLHDLPKKYYRMKQCSRMNTSVMFGAKLPSLSRCLNFAGEKKGLAVNFSPRKKQRFDDYDDDSDDIFFMNCEVLGCPNSDNLTSLVNDSRFDYYSLYGNTESLINSSCIPFTGVFHLNGIVTNYSVALNVCKEQDSSLAHILTEQRTHGLAQILAARKIPWQEATYVLPFDTVAFVGLGDQEKEGVLVSDLGEPLECFSYRAWAPGHPRKDRNKDDCVIIADDKTWRAVNCAKKLQFFCELRPYPPFWNEFKEFANSSCSDIRNRTMKRKCKKIKKRYKKAKKDVDYDKEMKNGDRCEDY